MRSSSHLAFALLAASLTAQEVTISSTVCTDNQMVGFWTTDTGSTVPGQFSSLVITSSSLTQGQVGELGFVVITAGHLGCGVSLPSIGFGPPCAGVPNDIPGPFIADPASLVMLAVVVPTWGMWCTHNLTLPISLVPASGSIDWTAQIVLYQSPAIGECWQATGNALHFAAHY